MKVLACAALVCLLSCLVLSTRAQDYKKFKVGLSIGGGACNSDDTPALVLVTLEPAYRMSENFTVGLRMEGNVFAGSDIDNTWGMLSFTASGQYYLKSDNKFRPFVGGGLGLYLFESGSAYVGFYPRVGFDVGHFSMSMDYNIVAAPTASAYGHPEKDLKFLGIRIGASFGGGKK